MKKTNEGEFYFFTTYKIAHLLKAFGSFKSKNFEVSVLLLSLLIFRHRGEYAKLLGKRYQVRLE